MKLCILNVWNFEIHFEFFSFKFNFLEFCNNFVPKFENLYYLLHLNTNESIKESSSENSESNQDCSQNSRKNACVEIGNGTSKLTNSKNIEGEINANGNQAIHLENKLKSNFVSKDVVNLSKQNLNDAEISLLSKGLNFVPTCNNIDKAKLKMELEAFGRMLRLKWHFRNENKDIHRDMFKPKSKFNPRNKDAAIELYLSSLEEKLMKVEVPKDKFNNLTKSERKALYDLKNDKSIVIKSADKGSVVVVWGREDYIKEAQKQLGDEQVYEEVSNDAAPLLKTINEVIAKIRKRGDLQRDNLDYFIMKDPKFARFYLLPKIYKRLHNSQVDQHYLIVVTILKIFPHFWTIIYNH